MNKNRITGAWESTKGKWKEEVGHATGNEKMASEGVADQIKGKIHKGVGKAKDAVKRGVDSALDDKKKSA